MALGVVMAAHGYPLKPRKGDAHHRPAGGHTSEARKTRWCFMPAPPRLQDGQGSVVTSGGRVLCVTALASSREARRSTAPTRLRKAIHFDGAQYRRDIGYRAIKP